jgi:hypothetical protein
MTYATAGLGPPGAGLAGTWLCVPLFSFLFISSSFQCFFISIIIILPPSPSQRWRHFDQIILACVGERREQSPAKTLSLHACTPLAWPIVSLAARLDTYVHVSGGRGASPREMMCRRSPTVRTDHPVLFRLGGTLGTLFAFLV